MATIVLSADGLSSGYGKKPIFQDLGLRIARGHVVVIFGLNGCGKSTLLKVLAGQLRAWGGVIRLFGRDVTRLPMHQRARLGVGYLLQGGVVFPTLTVRENLELSARLAVQGDAQDNIERVLERFPDLKSLYKRRSGLLSGGQRQMLALSIVLVRQPKVLLLDEPSAGLSVGLVHKALQRIQEIAHTENLSVVLIEHRQREALEIADTAYYLSFDGLEPWQGQRISPLGEEGAYTNNF